MITVQSGSSNTKISMQVVGWKIPTCARQNLATQTHCFERNQDSLADHIGLSRRYLCCPVKLPSKKKQCLLPQNPKSRWHRNLWKKNDVGKNGSTTWNKRKNRGWKLMGFFQWIPWKHEFWPGLTLLFITGLGFLSLSHDASGKKVNVKNKEPGKSSNFRIESKFRVKTERKHVTVSQWKRWLSYAGCFGESRAGPWRRAKSQRNASRAHPKFLNRKAVFSWTLLRGFNHHDITFGYYDKIKSSYNHRKVKISAALRRGRRFWVWVGKT